MGKHRRRHRCGALVGVGGRSLMTSILVLLFGADIVHANPLSVLAGGGHALLGWLLPGSAPGVLIGPHCSTRAPEDFVRPASAPLPSLAGPKPVTA